MKKSIAILSLLFIFAAQGLWAAHGGPERGDCVQPRLERLDLTKAQQSQINTITNHYKEQFKKNHTLIQAARAEVHAAMQAGQEDKLRAAHRSLCKLQEENLVLHSRMLGEIKPYLTAEQLKQLNEPPRPPRPGGKFFRHHAR